MNQVPPPPPTPGSPATPPAWNAVDEGKPSSGCSPAAKWLLGCLLVALVLLIGGCIGLVMVGRAWLENLGLDMSEISAMIEDIGGLEEQIENKTAFVAPANQQLTVEQIERLIAVLGAVKAGFGERLDQLTDPATASSDSKPGEVVSGYITAVREGIAVAAQALNAQGFSLSEYEWVRARTVEALRTHAAEEHLRSLLSDVEPMTNVASAEQVQANWALLEPRVKELAANAELLIMPLEF